MAKYNYEVIILATFKREYNFYDKFMVKVSNNTKKYRLEAGIIQEQLAVDLDKSYGLIRRLKYKKEAIGCSIDTLYKISVVLGIVMNNIIPPSYNILSIIFCLNYY